MNKFITAAAVLIIGAAPAAAFAAPTTLAVLDVSATPPVKTAVIHHARSTVHDWHGQRFDVPNSLLRDRTTLINGLPPQPQQFD